MSENLSLWNKVKQPPATALKAIGGGRLKGKTDINPQWRLEAITEHFGPCGIGWKYEIARTWTEPGPAGEVMAFVTVNLYVSTPEHPENDWSDPIPGIGGSMLVEKESAGLHANDEAFKMATTDALSVAMKQLGFAADIYMGRWDGSKYRDADDPGPAKKPAPAPATAQPAGKSGGDPGTVEGPVEAITTKFPPYLGVKVGADWYNTDDADLGKRLTEAKGAGHQVAVDWHWQDCPDSRKRKMIKLVAVFDENGEIVS